MLHDLKSVQGVTGAYILNSKGHILVNILPPIFKPPKLLNMGKSLVKIYAAARLNFPDVSEIIVTFEESILIFRVVVEKTFIIVVCEPSLNVNLITLSLNMIMEDLKQAVESLPTDSTATAPTPPQPAAAAPVPQEEPFKGKKASAKELVESGPLASDLQGIQTALAKVLGPMAKIILLESIEKWQGICLTSRETLPKLIDILTIEISGADKIALFKQLVTPIVSVAGK